MIIEDAIVIIKECFRNNYNCSEYCPLADSDNINEPICDELEYIMMRLLWV